ncbi:type VI secretion system lipoprotein TssJ [Taylorella equigenitalis]|uniref:Putative lipoprotein n=1 Tax=Taylorella equigenitalis (strain MCE9) TaxID=937774 RepID=A0A654KGX4_TAYEM|nr:type VI secretion system lipoprotein TssJ [Taylorella equigenitalis]ADU91649.1 putative lipoprotein [Taylorella equigenitalis MCE9]ASY37190.1 type VI secretion system lipoprotein TssJ [Taylorella equigenitalis]ASY41615.1 type VI secretion system-associated lipoprotein [Taylorella equigenitalis]KGK33676.1 type VI secretion lipofamily protein [Taylorella equigenitalis]RBA27122.1 type VI secretion system lipoprotein TssJ [Taylorella equigenitalis]
MKNLFKLVLLSLVATIVVACASTEKKLAVPYIVEISASPDSNQSNGRPSPIKVVVYELSSSDAFNQADFFTLQQDYRKVLGDQVLGVKSAILSPGETKELKFSGSLNSKHIGVIGYYKEFNSSKWRLLVDLPEAKSTNIYKFWQRSPKSARIRIQAGAKELVVLPPETK